MPTELSYPEGIEDISDSAATTNDAVSFVRFDIFERKSAGVYEPFSGINLYMPETLSNNQNVSWDTQSLGPYGSGEDRGFINSNIDRVSQSLESLKSSMTAKLYGGTDASGQDILANKEQKIVNPYLKMLFRKQLNIAGDCHSERSDAKSKRSVTESRNLFLWNFPV